MPIGFGLFLQRKGIGPGCGGHTPKAEGTAGDGEVNRASDGRDGAAVAGGNDFSGLLASGDESTAEGDTGQKGRDVGGGDNLQEGVGGIVFKPTHLARGIVKGQTLDRTECADGRFVKPFLTRHAEMVLVPEVDEAHDSPKIVDPIRIIKRHAPPMLLRRKAPQEQNLRILRQKRLEGMFLNRRFHHHKDSKIPFKCGRRSKY